jgi:TetR/AcrR family transcriptional regulator
VTTARDAAPRPAAAASGGKIDKRARILEVATEEFAEKGLAGARVDAIARKAQANKQLVYYYFGGKLGLYNEVLGHMIEESRQKILDEAALETLAAKLRWLARGSMGSNAVRWRRLLAWEALESDENEIVREADRRGAWQRHVANVEAARESGEVDEQLDPELLALALVSIVVSPYVLPQVTKFMTGLLPGDEEFQERHEALLGQLIAHLHPTRRDRK